MWMGKISKFSPLRIPDAFRQYASASGSDDPMDSWDPSEWDDPDSEGWRARLTPNHAGQWFIAAAAFLGFVAVILWSFQFVPLTHRNPWTFVFFGWPATLLVAYVVGREHGFMQNKALDWSFVITGRSLHIIPGKFVERFGTGDIQHIKFSPLKRRSYGAFNFTHLKLGDLEANREKLMSKATGSNRGPDSPAYLRLPGPLTGESSDTVLGRVFGVHGGDVQFHDSGQDTDMMVSKPSNLDDDIAGDVLNHLNLLDTRVIPELKRTISTVETQKERLRQRAEAERDPELDRMFDAVETMSKILRPQNRSANTGDTDREVEEINERAREQLNS